MNALNPPGRRQEFATATIRNDAETLEATHIAYTDAVAAMKKSGVKDVVFTLVLQPLLTQWARIGDSNPLGLDEGADETLVIVSFTVNWAEARHDAVVSKITRAAVEQIDAFALKQETAHRYRYINYCGAWQKPFEGYGEESLRFLREASRKYDETGMFQRGCAGGFKLGI